MRTYRPKSWSAQAREMADHQVTQTIVSGNPVFSLRFFGNSYRAPIIRRRAAKRFGRAMRKMGIDIFSFQIATESDKWEKSFDSLYKCWDGEITEKEFEKRMEAIE
jgi:hypothetical protein